MNTHILRWFAIPKDSAVEVNLYYHDDYTDLQEQGPDQAILYVDKELWGFLALQGSLEEFYNPLGEYLLCHFLSRKESYMQGLLEQTEGLNVWMEFGDEVDGNKAFGKGLMYDNFDVNSWGELLDKAGDRVAAHEARFKERRLVNGWADETQTEAKKAHKQRF